MTGEEALRAVSNGLEVVIRQGGNCCVGTLKLVADSLTFGLGEDVALFWFSGQRGNERVSSWVEPEEIFLPEN